MKVPHLSPQQRRIFELLFQDITDSEIANLCDVSPKTIHTHKNLILLKFGVKTRAGLLAQCFREGMYNKDGRLSYSEKSEVDT